MPEDVKPAAPEARVGSVTFLEAGETTRRRERAMVALLGVITGLLTVLVVGLAVAAIWLSQQYAAAREQVAGLQQSLESEAGGMRTELRQAIATTQGLSRDLLMRQATLSRDLAAQIGEIQALQARLDRQRAGFGQIPAGPFEKADYAIRMSQLALDEAMAINRHVAATQLVIAKNLALTPAQQKLLEDLNRQVPAK